MTSRRSPERPHLTRGMASAAATPIQVLDEHIRALEAAMAVCLADPKEKPVHRLRSHTRRIEALLQLLGHIRDLPPHRTEARQFRQVLRRLRRAAGKVRDLDVHQQLLETLEHELHSQSKEAQRLRKESEELRADEAKRRKRAADKLVKLLRDREAEFAEALENLRRALKPAGDLRVPVADLLGYVDADFQRVMTQCRLTSSNGKQPAHKPHKRLPALSDDQLHSVRKAAKVMRYMAEVVPRSKQARTTAKHFESLQELGGNWHDFLDLCAEAKSEFGPRHVLTCQLSDRARTLRGKFLHQLVETA